jgi:hypothetical protein
VDVNAVRAQVHDEALHKCGTDTRYDRTSMLCSRLTCGWLVRWYVAFQRWRVLSPPRESERLQRRAREVRRGEATTSDHGERAEGRKKEGAARGRLRANGDTVSVGGGRRVVSVLLVLVG